MTSTDSLFVTDFAFLLFFVFPLVQGLPQLGCSAAQQGDTLFYRYPRESSVPCSKAIPSQMPQVQHSTLPFLRRCCRATGRSVNRLKHGMGLIQSCHALHARRKKTCRRRRVGGYISATQHTHPSLSASLQRSHKFVPWTCSVHMFNFVRLQ